MRDYRGGAGGAIAVEMAANSPPDGYPMFILSTSQAIDGRPAHYCVTFPAATFGSASGAMERK